MCVLLAGWFGFDEVIATVGDELDADTVARWLTELGVPFDIAVAPFLLRGVDWRDVHPADHTHLVFVTRPVRDSPLLRELIARRPAQVEALVARSVASMRLHGLVLRLEAGRPVVACDPIEGGAEVTRQAAALDWPLVVPAEEVHAGTLDAALTRCLSGELAGAVTTARERGREGNARARQWLASRLVH